jgi:UDP-GlcNAc:undecaprenyl-phosphate GlcNAc-1-phosphate transferase
MSEFIRRRRAGDRLVIYGAGDGGSVVVRELLNEEHHYRVLGFIDDDPAKQRLRVQGYPVLGGYDTLAVLAGERAVDAVVVSARNMAPAKLQELEVLCAANDVALSRLYFRFEQLVAS